MKWIGQSITDFITRFRSDVYLEDIDTGTIASGGNLGLDSDNKIVKATVSSGSGDLTAIVAGTGLSGSNLSGPIPTLDVEAAQPGITSLGTLTELVLDGNKSVTPGDGAMIHLAPNEITDSNTSASGTAAKYTHVSLRPPRLHATNLSVTTTAAATLYIGGAPTAGDNQTLTNNYSLWVDSGDVQFDGTLNVDGALNVDGTTTLPGLTTIGATGVNTLISSDAIQMYNPVNDGNPSFSIGASTAEHFRIWAKYDSGAQTLKSVEFKSYAASGTANKGEFKFIVDEVNIVDIKDDGLNLRENMGISIAGTDILTDSSGTATLSNIDALDATTEATIESAIDTLGNLTSASSLATVGTIGTGVWEGTKITDVYTNTSGKRYGNTIKILPTDFMINHDVLTEPLTFKDGGNSGVAVSNASSEMIAFVTIPEGMKATALDIYATNNKTVKIYEIEVDSSFDFDGTTANETGNANTQITIDPAIDATAVNYLAIIYVATQTTHRIWGGVLTIAPQ